MGGNQNYESDDEAEEAQNRIDRILGGGGAQDAPQQSGSSQDPLGGDPLAGRQFRSRSARSAYEEDQSGGQGQMGARAPRQPSSGGRRALVIMGGVIALGLLVVLAVVLLGGLAQRGTINLPFFPTATPTATLTPTSTLTPTPTKVAPNLQLPQLTCIFIGEGCLNYCKDPANAAECSGARDFVKAQGADPDVWFNCIAPASGQVGEPKKCLEDAWRANNP